MTQKKLNNLLKTNDGSPSEKLEAVEARLLQAASGTEQVDFDEIRELQDIARQLTNELVSLGEVDPSVRECLDTRLY